MLNVLPLELSCYVESSIIFDNKIVQLNQGREHRYPGSELFRRKYEIASHLLSDQQLLQLRDFYIIQGGSLKTFLYNDPYDNFLTQTIEPSSSSQVIELEKIYSVAQYRYSYKIKYPFNIEANVPFSIVNNTSLQFHDIPATTKELIISCNYYIPVRFESDVFILPNTANHTQRVSIIEVL